MIPAVVYARFSPRPNAAECDSIRKQFQRLRAYCTAHGYKIVAVRWDRELSGKRADNRPGLQRALRDACQQKAILVVYKLDRLARSTQDCLHIVNQLREAEADLASVIEAINTRSPMGRFFITILAAFAELDREQISARTADAMRRYQQEGRRMGRADRCPWGTTTDPENPDRLVPNPAEQKISDLIMQLHAEGLSNCEIARRLDEAGLPCRGSRWHDSTVRQIVKRQSPTL